MNRGYTCIGLHNPKNPVNVGCTLRAAGCWEVDFVAVSGIRYKHAYSDTQKAWKHIPLMMVDNLRQIVPKGAAVIGVDILPDARPLMSFVHPEQAFYIFGAEDETLGADILSWCNEKVSIPTKFCLNLAATVNVVLYDRMRKLAA